jgi:hypothetical protein
LNLGAPGQAPAFDRVSEARLYKPDASVLRWRYWDLTRQGSQPLAGGRREAHHRFVEKKIAHPGGMTAVRAGIPPGCNLVWEQQPVVSLRSTTG